MKEKKWLWFLAPFALAAFVWAGGEIVQHLWNWLAPMLFGFRLITFWQALGLLVLCRILFGGWGGGGNRGGQHKEQKETRRWRWQRMTAEEQEMYKEWLRTRPGFPPQSSGEPA